MSGVDEVFEEKRLLFTRNSQSSGVGVCPEFTRRLDDAVRGEAVPCIRMKNSSLRFSIHTDRHPRYCYLRLYMPRRCLAIPSTAPSLLLLSPTAEAL